MENECLNLDLSNFTCFFSYTTVYISTFFFSDFVFLTFPITVFDSWHFTPLYEKEDSQWPGTPTSAYVAWGHGSFHENKVKVMVSVIDHLLNMNTVNNHCELVYKSCNKNIFEMHSFIWYVAEQTWIYMSFECANIQI